MEISELKFDENGLIPAVVIDAASKEVLMLSYMNRESLKLSMEKKLTVVWSRTRNKLWTKGSSSGHYQHIVSITATHNKDALLVAVKPDGPACRTGSFSCFNRHFWGKKDEDGFSYGALMQQLKERKRSKKEGSYASHLFESGIDKILTKVGEESTEVVIAAKSDSKRDTVHELGDLFYHVMLLMAQMDISLDDVKAELDSRHLLEYKSKQEK